MGAIDSTAIIALCNQALGLIGAKAIVLDGTSQNHAYCELFYLTDLYEILEMHTWNFAKKRAYALQTTDPLFGYDNAFTKPSDCVRMWRIDDDDAAVYEEEGTLILTDHGDGPPEYDDDGVDYLAGQYVSYEDVTYLVDTAFTSSDWTTDLAAYMTSQGDDYKILPVEYVYSLTTLSSWPYYAKRCLILKLAASVMTAIKQNEEAALNLQSMLLGGPKVLGYLDVARSADAQQHGLTKFNTGTFMNARIRGV